VRNQSGVSYLVNGFWQILGQNSPDSLTWGIVIVGRVLEQEFDDLETGFTGNLGIDIGKGAAPVNGKAKSICYVHLLRPF